jgi:hypothetical protein
MVSNAAYNMPGMEKSSVKTGFPAASFRASTLACGLPMIFVGGNDEGERSTGGNGFLLLSLR